MLLFGLAELQLGLNKSKLPVSVGQNFLHLPQLVLLDLGCLGDCPHLSLEYTVAGLQLLA